MLYMLETINSNKFPWRDEGFLKTAILGGKGEIKRCYPISELIIIHHSGYERESWTSNILGSNLVSLAQLSMMAPTSILNYLRFRQDDHRLQVGQAGQLIGNLSQNLKVKKLCV